MSIPSKFMDVARGKLDRTLYDEIYSRAVELDREAMLQPTQKKIENPTVVERVSAHINNEPMPPPPKPHVAARIEKRLEIDAEPADLNDLLRTVRQGGPNVSVKRQSMDFVQELTVNWRDKHFVVIYSKSRDKLITAYPYKKQHKPRLRSGRPKDWRERSTATTF